MARPHSFQRVGLYTASTESELVAGDGYRKSLGVSRQTFHRYCRQFGWTLSWCNGRLFLKRAELRAWEQKVLRGVFGGRPVVGQIKQQEVAA